MASNMSAQIEAQFNALGKTVASITPHIANVARGGTTDKIIDFTITFSSAHGYVNNVLLQTNATKNDGEYNSSSFLLGGTRLTAGSGHSSFTISGASLLSTTLRFTAPFPSQIATEEHIYLRTNLQSTNLETSNYTHSISTHSNHLLSSNSFAKIPIDTDFIHYASNSGTNEFFLNIPSRSITAMRFTLRDSKDRPISIIASQNTLGNVSCSFVLLVEVIQYQSMKPFLLGDKKRNYNAKDEGVIGNLPEY